MAAKGRVNPAAPLQLTFTYAAVRSLDHNEAKHPAWYGFRGELRHVSDSGRTFLRETLNML